MLKDCQNNKFALEVLRIVEGSLHVDKITAEMCYMDKARRDHAELTEAIREMDEKLTDEQKQDEFFAGCYEEFREKIGVYEQLFRRYEKIPVHV